MDIIEYEPTNLHDGRFCKVFHSDIIQQEKPESVDTPPHFHWHNSFEFNCSVSGTLSCNINGREYQVHDRDFLFVNPSVIHKSVENTSPFLGFAVLVPIAVIRQFFHRNDKSAPIVIKAAAVDKHRKEIMDLLMDINTFSRSEDPAALLGMNACVLQIFYLLFSENSDSAPEVPPADTDLKNPMPFTEYLDLHYREPISLESVSEHFGFSPAYFSRLFTQKTGRNFNAYLSSLRLDHATHLLETTDSSVPDISEESGFSSPRAFTELFKKVNKLTPKQYRDKCNEKKKSDPFSH